MKKILLPIIAASLFISCSNNKAQAQQDSKDSSAVECVDDTADCECGGDEEDMYEPGAEVQGNYHIMFYQLYKSFTVKGTPSIQSFVTALSPVIGDFRECDGESVMDNANGYFKYSCEGAGGVRYCGAYWNRKDGKKLFLFSWYVCEELYAYTPEEGEEMAGHRESMWQYFDSSMLDEEHGMLYDLGCVAYLYNETTHKLEPLDVPPFDAFNGKPHFLELPQKGKDIEVHEGLNGDCTFSTLKWNGMSFDKVK